MSATLVATFALLASAASLCLLPCELTPAVHAGSISPASAHCGDQAAAEDSHPAVTGTDGSCADEHRWEPPAADRLGSRASIGAAALAIQAPVLAAADSASIAVVGPITPPPGSLLLLHTPLRI